MNKTTCINSAEQTPKGEIIAYSVGEEIHLDVRLENETVWLTQAQMADLFQKNQSVVARHIQNAFSEKEIDKESNMQILHNTLSKYKPTTIYSLDVIISVGYRVKSVQGTLFRRWANQVLKDHLLKGYSINQRLMLTEERTDQQLVSHGKRLDDLGAQHAETEARLSSLEQKVDFFVKANIPTVKLEGMQNVHDRFIIVDETVYHLGASIKDLGKELTAFSVLEFVSKEQLLGMIKSK